MTNLNYFFCIFEKLMKKDVLIIITSYNRLKSLRKILKKIRGYDVVIYDDNSDFTINKECFYKFRKNHGKKLAWQKFNYIFKSIPDNYENYIFIPDDIEINYSFVFNAVKYWKEIKDDKKICLNLLTDKRIYSKQWTYFEPKIYNKNIIQTQWTDFCFISNYDFFKFRFNEIPLSRWKECPTLGSGCGGVISRYFDEHQKNMYHLKKSLVKHIGKKSLMNTKEREINPL